MKIHWNWKMRIQDIHKRMHDIHTEIKMRMQRWLSLKNWTENAWHSLKNWKKRMQKTFTMKLKKRMQDTQKEGAWHSQNENKTKNESTWHFKWKCMRFMIFKLKTLRIQDAPVESAWCSRTKNIENTGYSYCKRVHDIQRMEIKKKNNPESIELQDIRSSTRYGPDETPTQNTT